MHASSLKIAHYCLYVITTEAYTDACLRKFFFQTKISSVSIRVRSPCDLGYESWSQKTRFPVGENHMILRSLVLIQYERVTGRRTRRLFLCRAVAQLSATKNGHTKQNSKQTEAILYTKTLGELTQLFAGFSNVWGLCPPPQNRPYK